VKVKLDVAAIGQSKWYEYVIRFAFGGCVTALAGAMAKRYGPAVGGLFLAFPAIFPAAASLIEKHEAKKEGRTGKEKEKRATVAAGLDAVGCSFGTLGLAVFAIIVWKVLPSSELRVVLPAATLAWAATLVFVWQIWELLRKHARVKRSQSSQPRLSTAVPSHVNRRIR